MTLPLSAAAKNQAEKQRLRTNLTHKRQVIPADLQDTTRWKVINHLRALLTDTDAAVVALYHAFEAEIDLAPLAEELWRDGVTVCLPRVIERAHPLTFNIWREGDILESDLLGIMCATGAEIIPKLMLMPAIGYSKNGYRLGFGGGYYDRTCKALGGDTLSAIVCQTELEIDTFPAEYHDQRADYVVTGKELIKCRT